MKSVRTTPFRFVFSQFFSLWRQQFLQRERDTERRERKSPWKKH